MSYILFKKFPLSYKMRLQTCVYHVQSFVLLVFLLIVFGRWWLGIDEINSIFLFFIPQETDVSRFHKVYGCFRLKNLIKINGYCQTKGSLFAEITFCIILPLSSSFFLSFYLSSFFFLLSFFLSIFLFHFPFPLYLLFFLDSFFPLISFLFFLINQSI